MTDGLDSVSNQLVNQLIDSHGVKGTLDALARLSGYESTPPTITEFIDDDYYLGKLLGSGLFPVWRSALKDIYPNPFYSPYLEVVLTGCLVGSTEIVLEDGSVKTFLELVQMYESGKEVRVLSYNVNTGQLESKLAKYIRKSDSDRKVYTITMEDGSTITATENHRFLTSDNVWKRLDELLPGDDLVEVACEK